MGSNQADRTSKRILFTRLVLLAFGVILLAHIANLTLQSIEQGQATVQHQSDHLVRLVTAQTASTAQLMIADSSRDKLQLLVDNLASSDYILDATIYNAKAEVLAVSGSAVPLAALMGFGEYRDQPPAYQVRPFIEEVKEGDTTLGYIRISLLHQDLTAEVSALKEHAIEQGRILMLLTLVAGFLFALAIMPRAR